MGRKKKKIDKDENAESYCFVCKDGGMLRICDHRDCLKAYHPGCVNKDQSFLETDDTWTCHWHSCFMCKKTPKFHCFCCDTAVCACCLCDTDFPVVGEGRGFCRHCLTLVAHIEGISEEVKIDFNDINTYECLFKSYWENIKTEVGLTPQQLHFAYKRLNEGVNDICPDDLNNGEEEIDAFESDDRLCSDYNDISGTDKEKPLHSRKRGKRKPNQQKEKVKSKKKEFVGWASRSLFDFLLSIGKDISKELTQHDVVDIITEYCKGENLFDPKNKKMIHCDAKLQPIIGRKSVKKNNVYKHLKDHVAENFELFDEEVEYESRDKVGNTLEACMTQRNSGTEKKSEKKEIVESLQQKSCFASVISQNIRHVFLRRSVVEELLKHSETFDADVIGSFVRIRSDPYDYTQKNDYQVLQVTGLKTTPGFGEVNLDITLQFSITPKDARIHELSDADFSEEECQDLQRRVKEGLVKRPIIEELEKKARSLHKVITKHRIASELALLEKMINQANEKGWRKQLFDYMTRRELLKTPEEQSRLLLEIPEIIAEELEVESPDGFLSQKDGHKKDGSTEKQTSGTSNSQRVNSGVNGFHWRPDGGANSKGSDEIYNSAEDVDSASGPIRSAFASDDYQRAEVSSENSKTDRKEERQASEDTKHNHLQASHFEPLFKEHLDNPSQGQLNSLLSEKQCLPDIVLSEERQVEPVIELIDDEEQPEPIAEVIELSDDEEQASTVAVNVEVLEDLDSPIWYTVSPLGRQSGPDKLSVLKLWMDSSPREFKVRVWKTGQSPEEAVLLADVIHQVFGTK